MREAKCGAERLSAPSMAAPGWLIQALARDRSIVGARNLFYRFKELATQRGPFARLTRACSKDAFWLEASQLAAKSFVRPSLLHSSNARLRRREHCCRGVMLVITRLAFTCNVVCSRIYLICSRADSETCASVVCQGAETRILEQFWQLGTSCRDG